VETILASKFGWVPDDPIQSALDRLAKMNLLLILDNCEHVLSAATSMAQRILTFSPDVHVLVTSRRPTGAACERARRLDPLPTPMTERMSALEVTRSPAVEMFVSKANATGMRFIVSDANAAIVAELVRQLDGLPLAIELAAARMEESGLEAVLALVEEDLLGHITNGRRTAHPRHKSLPCSLEWSYSLLSPAEASAFRKLGIIDGSFTAAEAGRAASRGDDLDTADLLRGLHLASLIEASGETGSYVMSKMARKFALMKLDEGGEKPLGHRSRQKASTGSESLHFAMDTHVLGSQ
jgi:predicted ATPase